MKFNHKIFLMPLVTALAFALFFGLTQRATTRSAETIERIRDEFFHALELSHDLEKDLLTIRQLLTTAVTNADEDQVAAADTVAAHFRLTVAGCLGVPELADKLTPLLEDFDSYFDLARITTMEMIQQDLLDLDFQPGFLDRVAQMNRRYEKINRELADVVEDNDQQLVRAMGRMGHRIDRVRWIMNLTSLVFLGLLVVISIWIIGAVVRPVDRMSSVARAIAGGNLGLSLDHQSNDALGELADSIREMQSSLVRDIARREKAESDLIAAQGRIIQAEKMAVLGELVAGLAHELNTPLGTLASSVDVVGRSRRIIREKYVSGADSLEVTSDPRFRRSLEALDRGVVGMEAAADRIGELVAGLKTFSQLDKAEFQQTDLNQGIRNTLKIMDRSVPEGVEINLELGEIAPLLGYPAQLNQLILSLIMHAIRDITPPGTITVRTEQIADQAQITVTDTGCGYEPDALQALFKPGFKSDSSRVRMDWEMITCNSIVDRHGGSLAAESTPGQGTTYVINLPVWSKGMKAPEGQGSLP
ncbi:MAG: HAMP domain-containing sensor histidine kinase [Candidatus Krumholzibacteriota bacterium]